MPHRGKKKKGSIVQWVPVVIAVLLILAAFAIAPSLLAPAPRSVPLEPLSETHPERPLAPVFPDVTPRTAPLERLPVAVSTPDAGVPEARPPAQAPAPEGRGRTHEASRAEPREHGRPPEPRRTVEPKRVAPTAPDRLDASAAARRRKLAPPPTQAEPPPEQQDDANGELNVRWGQ